MKDGFDDNQGQTGWTRREFLLMAATGSAILLSGPEALRRLTRPKLTAEVFIAKVPDYSRDIAGTIRDGLRELDIMPREIRGKRVLLKPNLVETHIGIPYINTDPLVIRGAIEAFKGWGAAEVIVAEGPGHCRDSFLLVEESGLAEVLLEDDIRFVDLNDDDVVQVINKVGWSKLKGLIIPRTVMKADWVVSMAKMKTHHWAGVTLSMKNMFGIMPGSYYGWPKNVLHYAGIQQAILDINATLKPDLAIVDGIVGMEGDGPIMGRPRAAGALVIGRNFPAVDATCARIMCINPSKIAYLRVADGQIGTIRESDIHQRGETIKSVQIPFALEERIPAQKGIRL